MEIWMKMETESLVLRRIAGKEEKRRVKITTMVEIELIEVIKYNGLDLANTINLALEMYLSSKGYLK